MILVGRVMFETRDSDQLWRVYEPVIARGLVRDGMPATTAAQAVAGRRTEARQMLLNKISHKGTSAILHNGLVSLKTDEGIITCTQPPCAILWAGTPEALSDDQYKTAWEAFLRL